MGFGSASTTWLALMKATYLIMHLPSDKSELVNLVVVTGTKPCTSLALTCIAIDLT